MMEPDPENVSGEVVRRHSFEHRIDWGYVVLGVAVICIVWKVGAIFSSTGDDEGSVDWEESEGTSILVETDQQ